MLVLVGLEPGKDRGATEIVIGVVAALALVVVGVRHLRLSRWDRGTETDAEREELLTR